MNRVYEIIYFLLSQVLDNVHSEVVPLKSSTPFILFQFPNIQDEELHEDIYMEVDITHTSLRGVEDLVSDVESLLDYENYNDTELLLRFQKINKLSIKNDEPNEYRRKIMYNVKLFEVI